MLYPFSPEKKTTRLRKLFQDAFNPSFCVIKKGIEHYWSKYGPLQGHPLLLITTELLMAALWILLLVKPFWLPLINSL